MNDKRIDLEGSYDFEKSLNFNSTEQSDNDSSLKVIENSSVTDNLYVIVLDYCMECYYAFCELDCELKRGDLVVAETRYGLDVVRVAGAVKNRAIPVNSKDVTCIKNLANTSELKKFAENNDRVQEANKIFREKVALNGLDMRLVTSHFLVPDPKVIFFFTADTRVDFRRLVKDLVSVFKLRVELRQIASRDESKISGGIGQCGRSFCCCCFSEKPPNVSTKMARDQKFSLISQKATGPCARLMCCLAFEHEWYVNEKRRFPPKGFRFSVAGKSFVVSDINMVIGSIMVIDQQDRVFEASPENFSYKNNIWKADHEYFMNLESKT